MSYVNAQVVGFDECQKVDKRMQIKTIRPSSPRFKFKMLLDIRV